MKIREITLRIRFVVEDDDGSFHAFCPDFPGLHVDGQTVKEALANAKQAAGFYLASLMEHNQPIPVGMVHGDHTYSLGEFLWQYAKSKFLRQTTSIEDVRIPEDCLAAA